MPYIVKAFDKNQKIFRAIPKKKPAHYVDYDIRIANEAVANAVEGVIEKLGVLFLSNTRPLVIGDGDVLYNGTDEITLNAMGNQIPLNFFGLDFNSPSGAFSETLTVNHNDPLSDRTFGVYLSFPATQKISSEKVDANYGEYFAGISKAVDDAVASVVNQIPGPTLVTYEGMDFVTLGNPNLIFVSDTDYMRVNESSSQLNICRLFTVTLNTDQSVSVYDHYAPRFDTDLIPYFSGRGEVTLEDYITAIKSFLYTYTTSEITALRAYTDAQLALKASLAEKNVFTSLNMWRKGIGTSRNITTSPVVGSYIGATAKSFVNDLNSEDIPNTTNSELSNWLLLESIGKCALNINTNHAVVGSDINSVGATLVEGLVINRIFRHASNNPDVNGGMVTIEIDMQHLGAGGARIEVDNDHICAASNLLDGSNVGTIPFQPSRLVQNKAFIRGYFEDNERFRITQTSAYPGEMLYDQILDIKASLSQPYSFENLSLNTNYWELVPGLTNKPPQVAQTPQGDLIFRGYVKTKSSTNGTQTNAAQIVTASNRPTKALVSFIPEWKDMNNQSLVYYNTKQYVLQIQPNGYLNIADTASTTSIFPVPADTRFDLSGIRFHRLG